MANLVNISVNNSPNKKIMGQTQYLPVFDFMGFKLLYEYNYSPVFMSIVFFKTIKIIIMALLSIFIFISCYYFYMYIYNSNCDNDQVITTCITKFEELKPINSPNIKYKSIINDFLNQFTSKGKTINHEFIKIKPLVKTIPLDNKDIIEKSIILNKIKSDHMNSIISECEFYKNEISLLEIQLQ
jgi:hypothetical protein